jgi:hypothetical protein
MLPGEDRVYETVFFAKREFEGRKCHVARIDYLEVLNARQISSQGELEKLKVILSETDEPGRQVAILLDVRNWRPHLIGCLAAMLVQDRALIVEALWRAFDRASWVCPQLAATLSLLDDNFVQRALDRLRCGALIKEPSEIMVEIHKNEHIENPKGFMSLWGLLADVFHDKSLESSELLGIKGKLESQDRDQSAVIALSWRAEVQAMLSAQQGAASDARNART